VPPGSVGNVRNPRRDGQTINDTCNRIGTNNLIPRDLRIEDQERLSRRKMMFQRLNRDLRIIESLNCLGEIIRRLDISFLIMSRLEHR